MKVLYPIFFLACALSGCKHTSNFNDFPIVSYSSNIEPIIAGNCTQTGCHGTTEQRRFSLLSYDDVIRHCRVQPGKPDNSTLYTITNTYNEANVMPVKPYNKLTETQIQLIYVWIGQGAKNN